MSSSDELLSDILEVEEKISKRDKAYRYPIIWADDCKPNLSAKYLIDDVIEQQSMIVTYGESGSGKTFHVIDQDMCIATGQPWFNHKTTQGTVLYVAAEGHKSAENRVVAYRKPLLVPPKFALLPSSINLFNPDADIDPLIDNIKRIQDETGEDIVKVTLDTLARVMSGGNENSSEDMGLLIHHADRIREECKATVHFIHQSGKDLAKGARGHSSLRAATDTEIEVKNVNDRHIVKITKQRDGEMGREYAFDLKTVVLGENESGKEISTCVPEWDLFYSGTKDTQRPSKSEYSMIKFITQFIDVERLRPPKDVMTKAKHPPKEGQLICRISTLKAYVDESGGVSDAAKPESRQKARDRALNGLRDKGYIVMYEDFLWWK
jgi:hypothetical protein